MKYIEKLKNNVDISKCMKILYVITAILFAMPSIIYLCENRTVLHFNNYFNFLLNNMDKLDQTLIYIIVLVLLTIIYFGIIKNREKIFKNIKEVYIYVAIIASIFVLVIPFTSSDIFYYLGIGRIDSKYNQNPYYVTIKQFVDKNNAVNDGNGTNNVDLEKDTVLAKGYENVWSDTTVVYGPVWTLMCRFISGITFGNIDIALLVFKIFNLLAHILSCYLIYKITNKKIFAIIYGVNPFVLIEGIANVHNDIYMITLVLSSIYFLKNKKNILLSVIFLALATAIKYFTILILPFVVIYYFRNEKPTDRLKKCILYGGIFTVIIGITYLLYVRDISVLNGMLTQQEKVAKNFYVILSEYFCNIEGIIPKVNKLLLGAFVIIYFFKCVTLLFKKKIKFRKEMQVVNYFLLAFIFLLITNFQIWYLMWIFPLIPWQNALQVKNIVQISLISQFANSVFFLNGEGWKNGTPFTFAFIVGILSMIIVNEKMQNNKKVKAFSKKINKV